MIKPTVTNLRSGNRTNQTAFTCNLKNDELRFRGYRKSIQKGIKDKWSKDGRPYSIH